MQGSPHIGTQVGAGGSYPHGFEHFDHFVTAGFLTNTAGRAGKFDETANSGDWLVTVTDGGGDNAETILVADNWPGGWLAMTPNNAAADGMTAQLNGEAFRIEANKTTIIRFRLAPGDIDKVRWFVGLANTNAANICAASASWTDYIGFGNYNSTGLDGTPDGSIACIIGRDATENDAIGAKTTSASAFEQYVDSAIDFSADTTGRTADYSREFAIIINGNKSATFLVDGAVVFTWTDASPGGTGATLPHDAALTPTFGFAAVDTSQPLLYVDLLHFYRDE